MVEILISLIGSYWKEIAAMAGVVAVFGSVYLKGRGDQKSKQQAEHVKAQLAVTSKILEIRDRNNADQNNNRKTADSIINDPDSGFDR